MRIQAGLRVQDPQYVAVLTYLIKAEQDSYNKSKTVFNWCLGICIAIMVAALSVASSIAFPPFAFIFGYALGTIGVFVFLSHKKN